MAVSILLPVCFFLYFPLPSYEPPVGSRYILSCMEAWASLLTVSLRERGVVLKDCHVMDGVQAGGPHFSVWMGALGTSGWRSRQGGRRGAAQPSSSGKSFSWEGRLWDEPVLVMQLIKRVTSYLLCPFSLLYFLHFGRVH